MLHLARRRPSETGASLVLNSQKSCGGHRKGKKKLPLVGWLHGWSEVEDVCSEF